MIEQRKIYLNYRQRMGLGILPLKKPINREKSVSRQNSICLGSSLSMKPLRCFAHFMPPCYLLSSRADKSNGKEIRLIQYHHHHFKLTIVFITMSTCIVLPVQPIGADLIVTTNNVEKFLARKKMQRKVLILDLNAIREMFSKQN